MNIFLVPYTWLRHLQMALWCGAAGLLAWWTVLSLFVLGGPQWAPRFDGPVLLGAIAAGVAGASTLGELNLRRDKLYHRVWKVALSAGLALLLCEIWYTIWHTTGQAILFRGDLAEDASDPSLVSLSYRLGAFAMAGLGSGLGPLILRKGHGWFNHIAGGVAAGLAGAAVWHLLNLHLERDLYLAGAGLGFVWGAVHGLLCWSVPDALYAGWIRVLTPNRYGRRIPVDGEAAGPKERFVGHFPRGLDLFLGVEDGVQELHLSVAVDGEQRYVARGLSQHPTQVKRFLERVDLRYDPRRPAPLETRLSSGDRLRVGEGEAFAEVEFLMLPREER